MDGDLGQVPQPMIWGHGAGEQLAQAVTPASVGTPPIGQVETLSGEVTVLHADGQREVLSQGDSVHVDDRLETGTDGSVGLVLVDGSTLSLGAEGAMVLDRFVYDPGTGEGESSVSMLNGLFSFASGAIAKSDPDASTITTPVGTIGVRGTTGTGRAGPEGTENILVLVVDDDGTLGEILWTNPGGTSILNQPNQSLTTISGFQAPTLVILSPQQVSDLFGSVLGALPNPTGVRFNFDATRPVDDPDGDDPDADGGADGGEDEARGEGGEGTPEGEAQQAALAALEGGATPEEALEAALNAALAADPDGGAALSEAMRAIYLDALANGMTPEEALALVIAMGALPTESLEQDLALTTTPRVLDLVTLSDLRGSEDPGGALGRLFGTVTLETDLTAVARAIALFQARHERILKAILDRQVVDDTDTDGDLVSGNYVFTSGSDTVVGDSGDTTFIFDQSKNGGLGGSDEITDKGGVDTILIQDPETVVFGFGAASGGGTTMLAWEGNSGTTKLSIDSLGSGSAVMKVSISDDVEKTEVSYGGQTRTSLDPLDLSGSERAWLVVGNGNANKFSLDDADTVTSLVLAGAGNDVIEAKAGSGHSIYGESGDDVFWLRDDVSITTLGGGAGTDVVFVDSDQVTVNTMENVEKLVRVGSDSADTLSPSASLGGQSYTYVWGRGGADTISVASGRLGVLFSTEDLSASDNISNFTTGASQDGLVFDDDILSGTGEQSFTASANIVDSNSGIVLYDQVIANPATAANVAADVDGAYDAFAANSKIVFLVGSASDSYAWYWNDASGNGDGVIDAGELTQIAKIDGVNITDMTLDNLAVSTDDELFEYQDG